MRPALCLSGNVGNQLPNDSASCHRRGDVRHPHHSENTLYVSEISARFFLHVIDAGQIREYAVSVGEIFALLGCDAA